MDTSLALTSYVTMTELFNLSKFHFPLPRKRKNDDNSTDSVGLNNMPSSSQKVVAAIITQVWMPDHEVQLSRELIIFPSNSIDGVPNHRYHMQRHGLFMQCVISDSGSQDGWRGDWWRLRKIGDSGGVLFFFLHFNQLFSSGVHHHSKRDAFWESFISDHMHYAEACNNGASDSPSILEVQCMAELFAAALGEEKNRQDDDKGRRKIVWESKKASLHLLENGEHSPSL